MIRKIPKRSQSGVALFSALILVLVMGALVTTMAISFTGQNKFNQRSWKYEKSLMMAETGVQRVITGLAHENDAITWDMKNLSVIPSSPPSGFWLWSWQSIKNEQGKEIGRYRIEIMPGNTNKKRMRLKAYGMAFEHKKDGTPTESVQRAIGVELRQISLGDFAIASNHQLGGARINGGARIYGGILTGGELHLDSSSTGVFNDYLDIQDNQNFSGYTTPATAPEAEIFVYKDPNLPAGANNGTIKLASQAALGTSTQPMKKIHTAETSTSIDPGNGDAITVGDGIIGQGEGRAKGPRDHRLPDLQFPDASSGSGFMNARQLEAQQNGNAVYNGDLVFGSTSFTIGDGPALTYDGATGALTINGPVLINGNVQMTKAIQYDGKGGLFVDGNVASNRGIEPATPAGYPDQHALGLVATGDMQLGSNSGSSTKYAGFFFGNRSLNLQKAKIFGNVFGNTINLPTTGTRPDIYVHPDVMASTGVTLPDFNQAEIVKEMWWEMNGSAAR